MYYLKGLICTPTYNHFTSLVNNSIYNIFNLEKGLNYLYDSNANSNKIMEVKNLNEILEENLPYLALYSD